MPVARLSRSQAKARTRDDLLAAADRLFTSGGFHATPLDAVAADAGYTKGAVYSNFESKEDLFFAVYERRVERARAEMAAFVGSHGEDAPMALAARTLSRTEAGWVAVFFEFWAHVVRNPELRARFAAIHRRAREELVEWARDWMQRNDVSGIGAEEWTRATFAMVSVLALEQLIEPGLDGSGLAVRMFELMGG